MYQTKNRTVLVAGRSATIRQILCIILSTSQSTKLGKQLAWEISILFMLIPSCFKIFWKSSSKLFYKNGGISLL